MTRGITAPASRRGGLGRALLTGLSLVVAVAVVPVVLWRVGGWPVSAEGIRHVAHDLSGHGRLGSHLMAEWLLHGALVLAWCSWVWMTACIVVELRAWRTGRRPVRFPVSRWLQSLAAFLIGTTLAVSALSRVAHASATGPAAQQSATGASPSTIRVLDDAGFDRTGAPAPGWGAERPIDGAARPDELSQVGHQASLAVLADRSPAVMADRSPAVMAEGLPPWPDASGSSPVSDHVMPTAPPAPPSTAPCRADQVGRQEARHGSTPVPDPSPHRVVTVAPASESPSGTHLVAARETLWSIASDRLGAPRRWKEIASLNYGLRQPDGGVLTRDHWITPGWTLLLPDTEVAAARWATGPGSVPVPAPSEVPRVSNGRPSGPTPRAWADDDRPAGLRPMPVLPVLPVGGSVVGAGVVSILDRMRRAQQRHREEGSLIRLPDPERRGVEERLRVGDGLAAVTSIDETMAMVHRWWRDERQGGGDLPRVEGVRLRSDEIELIIGQVGATDWAAPPFAIAHGAHSVTVERSGLPGARPAGPTSGVRAAAPLLITAGRADDESIMVNLEPLGSLVIRGELAVVEGVLRSLALELATSHWTGQFELVLVGFGGELERFTRVTTTLDVVGLVDALGRRRVSARARLAVAGFGSCAEARALTGDERWDPLVVICGSSVAPTEVEEIIEAGEDPAAGMVVIATGVPGDSSRGVTWSSDRGPATLDLLASVIEPQTVAPGELASVTSLLETATRRDALLTSDEPYVRLPVPLPRPLSSTRLPIHRNPMPGIRQPGATPAQGGQVEVAVLGQVEVRGAAREFTRAWAKELVVYLAMHPNGSSTDTWATALWPDRLMAPSSLHSTASVARRALGQGIDGLDHLPRSHGRLALASTVVTDWGRFVELADTGDVEQWRVALSLVRGRLFDGLRASDWPILEGIAPAMEAAIVDLSGRLAGSSLSRGEAGEAAWAARKGLLVSPYDERLYRMLMRAADAAGNPAGVEGVMTELVTLVSDGVEPFDSVHPSTMELYRSLTRGSRRSVR